MKRNSLAGAIAREGASLMKGESSVPPIIEARTAIDSYVSHHLNDGSGCIMGVLHNLTLDQDVLIASHLKTPLLALKVILKSILKDDNHLIEFVRKVDQKWGEVFTERPKFQFTKDSPAHPEDEYTIEDVRIKIQKLLEDLVKELPE